MKKKLNIINVGRIYIDDKFINQEEEDHTKICIYYDGQVIEKFTLTIPGLKALYAEIGDHLREMEAVRNPK